MPRVAVAGATGFIGRLVTAHVAKQGHTPLPLSRSSGVDLVSGDGLDAALSTPPEDNYDGTGILAVIDCSDVGGGPLHADPARILAAAKVLNAAAVKAHIPRVVMLSIEGVQKAALQAFPFYKARHEQEGVVLGLNHRPGSGEGDGNGNGATETEGLVVRSAQWFEFAMNPVGAVEAEDEATGTKEVRVQDWAIQPCAADSVAAFLVQTALQGIDRSLIKDGKAGSVEDDHVVVVAGPERLGLPELTTRYLRAQGDERPVVHQEPALTALRDGGLYGPDDSIILQPKLGQWLEGLKAGGQGEKL